MAFTNITDAEREGKGNVGQPDTPLLTTTEMQEQMDSLTNLAIDKFNNHIVEISLPSGAGNIGCEVPEGITADTYLQSVINAIATEALQSVSSRHVHPNKTTLDAISPATLTSITDLIAMFILISGVDTTVSGDADKLPTSSAIVSYINSYDWKSKIRDSIYPVGSIYQTTSIDPDTLFGTSGHWQLVNTVDSIKTYKRLS